MWSLSTDDRLSAWKSFRREIDTLPFADAVAKTVQLWSYAPFVPHYLDTRDTRDWPTPWELIADGKFDDAAKALGMLYTLALTHHGAEHEFDIAHISSSSGMENYNLVRIDQGKYILNYAFGEVISNTQLEKDSIEVLQIHSSTELPLPAF